MQAMPTQNQKANMRQLEKSLKSIGYSGSRIRHGYRFTDPRREEVDTVSLAAFRNDIPDGRNVCFGADYTNGLAGEEFASHFWALGAPVFEIAEQQVNLWKIPAEGQPELIESIPGSEIDRTILKHKDDWHPDRIYRAKSIEAVKDTSLQLGFVDIGLWPAIEKEIRERLDRLLTQTIKDSIQYYKGRYPDAIVPYKNLFRLVFRLLAGKVLFDKGGKDSDQFPDTPGELLEQVEQFYGDDIPRQMLENKHIVSIIWDVVRNSINFQNVTPETLAYIYENTLVTKETRKAYGTHSTPVGLAEYIVRQLPIENLDSSRRYVFEPCSGHGIFLIAAMKRIKELSNMTGQRMHEYLKRRLVGMEADSFAVEVSKLGLTLADYPNPDGWNILNDNVFASTDFEECLKAADIVLCNPPFEDFPSDDPIRKTVSSVHKPAEALSRVLEMPPEMLGFVLPRTFVDGLGYKKIRSRLAEVYDTIRIEALPDKIFYHSETESALLLAWKNEKRNSAVDVNSARVFEEDREKFLLDYQPTFQTHQKRLRDELIGSSSLFVPPLSEVWDYLSQHPKLGDLAEIHRGIEYNISVRENREMIVSDTPLGNYQAGIWSPKNILEPFFISNTEYLNLAQELMRGNSYKLEWEKRKIIVNAVRSSRSPWRIEAAIDNNGLVFYHNFSGIWPKMDALPIYAIEAILNSPIANSFLFLNSHKKHNSNLLISQIPLPHFNQLENGEIQKAVSCFTKHRSEWLNNGHKLQTIANEPDWDLLLKQIDALVLKAYNLPARLERQVLDVFKHCTKRGPFDFKPYFPDNYKSWTPYHEYLSERYSNGTAKRMLSEAPDISDPEILAALEDVSE